MIRHARSIRSITAPLMAAGGKVIDWILPPRCLVCGTLVERQGGLCATCWSGLRFIAAPQCERCGQPFAAEIPEELICAGCHAQPPRFARARASLIYDERSRPLVTRLKFADATHIAPAMGPWLQRAAAQLVVDADLIAPVPLHRRRLFHRRFNQSALLAQALGKAADRPVTLDLLQRGRSTPPQTGLSRRARRRNVQGAFAVRDRYREAVSGKRILLVDDVLTTGATVDGCARALARHGAVTDVVTLARAVMVDG